jgi:hypothetical protein
MFIGLLFFTLFLHYAICLRRSFLQSSNRDSVVVTGLLSQAAQATQRLMKSDTTKSKVLKPALLSFSAFHTENIKMEDVNAAVAYLSLPAANYSVLNAQFVEKSGDDTFNLTLPLGNVANSTGVVLRTSVIVTPDPANRIVKMRSGPLFFSSASKGDDALLPECLVWSGRKESDGAEEGEGEGENESVLASVQAGFQIELTWGEKPKNDTLVVTAKVGVSVDMSLPLRSDVASAVNFPLVQLLLSQAGKLTAVGVLRTTAPGLAQLLVRDHEQRKATRAATASLSASY